MQGCQYREHTVQIDTDRDRAILKLAQMAADEVGCIYQMPPASTNKDINTSIGASSNTTMGIDPWWNGMALLPNRERQGLLPSLNVDGKSFKLRLFFYFVI